MTYALRKAAEDMVKFLDNIVDDPSYRSVFTIAALHHASYRGPTWEKELEALRQALAPTPPTTEAGR